MPTGHIEHNPDCAGAVAACLVLPIASLALLFSRPGLSCCPVVVPHQSDGDRCRTTCLPRGKYVLHLQVEGAAAGIPWLVGMHTAVVRRDGVRVETDGRAPPLTLLPEVPHAQDGDSKREVG